MFSLAQKNRKETQRAAGDGLDCIDVMAAMEKKVQEVRPLKLQGRDFPIEKFLGKFVLPVLP